MTGTDRTLLKALVTEVITSIDEGKDVSMSIHPTCEGGIGVHVSFPDKIMVWAVGKSYCDRVEDIFTALEQL